MKDVKIRKFIFLVLILGLSSCVIKSGSNLLVGKKRSPINVEDVKIYTKPPLKYEEIAIVMSESKHAFVSKQTLVDAAVLRLKEEAAKLGANGIILEGIGNFNVGGTGILTTTNPSSGVATGTFVTSTNTGVETKGMAIYVSKIE